MTQAWVPVIAFDIIFADKSNFSDSDKQFSQVLEKSNNVIFWLSLTDDNYLLEIYSLFKNKIINSGYLRPNVDNRTDVIYSIIPMSYFSWWEQKEHFSISILKSYYSYIYSKDYYSNIYWIKDNKYYITPDISVPLSRTWINDYRIWNNNEKDVLINYINRDKFTTLSFYDIYNKNNFEELKEFIDFENKIVLVWFTAKWIKDVFNTPSGSEYWVYIHANMINTVLTKSFLVYFNKTYEWILILLLIIVSVYFNLSRSWYILFLSNILIVLLFIIIFPFLSIKFYKSCYKLSSWAYFFFSFFS